MGSSGQATIAPGATPAAAIRAAFEGVLHRLVLTIVLVVGVIAALVSVTDIERVGAAVAASVRDQPALLLAIAAPYTLAFWLRAVAWQRLLPLGEGTATRPPAAALFSILQASLVLNHALPMKLGEVVRPMLLARRGTSLPVAVTSTLVARALDVALLALIAAATNLDVVRAHAGSVLVAALLVASFVGAVVVVSGTRGLPSPLRARAIEAAHALRAVDAPALGGATLLVGASWLLEAAVALGAARMLGIDLDIGVAAGATTVAVAFQVVQVTPGGLGVYEASMAAVLVAHGMPAGDALALATLTHGLKFGYSFTIGVACALPAALSALRGRADGAREASRLEVLAARAWNVLNEGKPFTPVFAVGVIALLAIGEGIAWPHALLGAAAIVPLALVWWRFDFPLRLRAALWVALLAFVALFRVVSVPGTILVLSLYLTFTVVLWGTVYYHLRIGTPWTNFTRFWRLVVENPDPTSGNFLEQVPKTLLLVYAFTSVARAGSWQSVAGVEVFVAALALGALLLHQWFFTWVPPLPQRGLRAAEAPRTRAASRVIVIAIDGCRADRLREAHTPFLERLRAEGTDYTQVSTVYPARTVTAFSSMLTGAPPEVHDMRSNFVPRLGVRCESVFDVLRAGGMSGVFVGIAHLIDAFGTRDVRTVTAVTNNEDIDAALVARAQRALVEESPDLLVLQLLHVDQTGHARGSYHDEYLHAIEATDRTIEGFVTWCAERGYLDGTTLLVTSDHGQGIGIGGHGHMSPPEILVPCIWAGAGVEADRIIDEPRSITEIASTLCNLLGLAAPAQAVGGALLPIEEPAAPGPVVFVLPAHNEEAALPAVLDAIARADIPNSRAIVVDDGSTDATASIAELLGALVVRHPRNRGLGAALRTGLAAARDLRPRAVVYLDADGEYDPADARTLLAPIEAGTADYVTGSRFPAARAGAPDGMPISRRIANTMFSALLSLLSGHRITDGQSGMRAFSPRALEVAEIVHDYNYAQVLTLDLLHKGIRMTEVPITYRRRQHGRSFVSAEYLWRVPLGMAREMWAG